MITLGSLTLTVGALLLVNGSGDAAIADQNNLDGTPENSEELTISPFTYLDEPLPDPIPARKKTIYFPILTEGENPISEDGSEEIYIPKEDSSFIMEYIQEEPISNVNSDNGSLAENQGEDFNSPCRDRVNIGDDIDNLKEDLVRLLAQDQLLPSGDYKARLLVTNGGFSVNGEQLNRSIQSKYVNLLKKYDIKVCDNRMIQISPRYVAAGEVTSEGFKGQLRGDLDIDELKPNFDGKHNYQGKSTSENNNSVGQNALILKNTDSRADFDAILAQLKTYGFIIQSKSFNENDGLITSFRLHLKHSRGLDFNLRTRNFTFFELKVQKNNNGKATNLHYKFNGDKKYTKVGLTAIGSISRTF